MDSAEKILNDLIQKYPLKDCAPQIMKAYQAIYNCFENKGKLMICGNGGSSCDADHIAGELMKGFMKKRPLNESMTNDLKKIDPMRGQLLSQKLQMGLPAIPLTGNMSVISAVANDNDPKLIYAQQVLALGARGDVLLGISTSGNAENVICSLITAKSMGITTIGLSGPTGGVMKSYCDILMTIPGQDTPAVQELHLPVYHALCRMIEASFFDV